MHSEVSSDWLPSYIKATRPVLEIFKMDTFWTAYVQYFNFACFVWVVKLDCSHWRRNVNWGCLRTGFWEEYLGLGGSRILHNEAFNDLYSPNIVRVIKSRRIRWAGHVARMGERRDVYRVLVRKPEGERPLGRDRCRWEDNIKMDFQELGCGGMDWRALVNAVMKCREFLDWLNTS